MDQIEVTEQPKAKRSRKPREAATTVQVAMPETMAKRARGSRFKEFIRKSSEMEVNLISPNDFFKKMNQPVESRLHNWVKEVAASAEEHLDTTGRSKIIEINPLSGQWRWRVIKDSAELRSILKTSEQAHSIFMKMREAQINKFIRGREDVFGGMGFADDMGSGAGAGMGSFPARHEFTPLIGTPFFKQMYLADYWEMHSKCFWYSNYSGIAKLIVDLTRNFVMGKGFNVQFEDDKAQGLWDAYEDRTEGVAEASQWCDDLTKFGENMIRKVPGPKGLIHKAFDPSTIWEIVTDPENISDVKYYHQQYNTQYQLYGTKDAPISKYIINQLPPELVIHTKVNVTPYEKRGRSDLLSPLLYFKYYEDYMQAKLIRAKNEAAFIWDVEIDGSDQDVADYITNSQSIMDVPPGSENVHNKAIKRTPLSPQLTARGADQTAQDILSYVAMATSIPVNYFGTFGTGGSTKAGSLVATEPVAKKMVERQNQMERIIRKVVKDVLIDGGLNPNDEKYEFEVNFPEILEEDRSAKIQDLIMARDNNVIAHETMSYIVAKELKITKYNYEKEQQRISDEAKNPLLTPLDLIPDLTQASDGGDDKQTRAFDRSEVKKDGKTI